MTDVFTRPSDDGLGTYREMSMGDNKIIENIYHDKSTHEVKFSVVNDDVDIMNVINFHDDGTRTLELYKRKATTKERIHWAVPKHVSLAAINKIFELATTNYY